ncbi:MAG: hypothetical protein ACFFDR_13760 [Candidatus Thorarchaeota archaeon]
MILVILLLVAVWFLVDYQAKSKLYFLLSAGLILSYIIAMSANLPPILDIPLENNTALRAYPPFAFPFTILQYRDYDAGLFNYILALGWPVGIPFFQFAINDDQSEYIHYQHYQAGLLVGILLLLCAILTAYSLVELDKRGILSTKRAKVSPLYILVFLQLALVARILLWVSFVYLLGGIVVLVITSHQTWEQIRILRSNSRELTEYK